MSVLNGKCLPGAGYCAQRKWLLKQGENELKCPSDDVITFFDNIGKYVKKNYRVSSQKTPRSKIVTLTLHIDLGSDIQTRSDLKPIHWEQGLKQEQHIKMLSHI